MGIRGWRDVVAAALAARCIREPLGPSELAYAFGLQLKPRPGQGRPVVLADRLYYPPSDADEVLRFVSEAISERILTMHGFTLIPALVQLVARCLRAGDAGLTSRVSGEWPSEVSEQAEAQRERSSSEMRIRTPELA